MKKRINRREFLKNIPFLPASLLKSEETENKEEDEIKKEAIEREEKFNLIRPPYSQGSDFTICKDCEGNCISACEEGIIKRFKDGSPYIVFNYKGCTFCEKCAEACEYGVLDKEKPSKIYMNISINTDKCMSWNNVMCFSCKDPCLDNAIKFQGIFKPEIDLNLCSGCGFCLSVCPSGAIEIFPPN